MNVGMGIVAVEGSGAPPPLLGDVISGRIDGLPFVEPEPFEDPGRLRVDTERAEMPEKSVVGSGPD